MRIWLYLLLAIVALAAAVLSFSALRDLAIICGFSPWLAWLLPITVDAGAAAASIVWLARWVDDGARSYGRVLALVLLASSVAGNAVDHYLRAYGIAPKWWVVVIVSAVAPAVLAALVHLVLFVVRSTAPANLDAAESAAGVPVTDHRRFPTSLYRLYDEDDTLLYVGITSEPLAHRLAVHRRKQPWWSEVARTLVDQYPTRLEGLKAERDAILTERPKYNRRRGAMFDHACDSDGVLSSERMASLEAEVAELVAFGWGQGRIYDELQAGYPGLTENRIKFLIREAKDRSAPAEDPGPGGRPAGKDGGERAEAGSGADPPDSPPSPPATPVSLEQELEQLVARGWGRGRVLDELQPRYPELTEDRAKVLIRDAKASLNGAVR